MCVFNTFLTLKSLTWKTNHSWKLRPKRLGLRRYRRTSSLRRTYQEKVPNCNYIKKLFFGHHARSFKSSFCGLWCCPATCFLEISFAVFLLFDLSAISLFYFLTWNEIGGWPLTYLTTSVWGVSIGHWLGSARLPPPVGVPPGPETRHPCWPG